MSLIIDPSLDERAANPDAEVSYNIKEFGWFFRQCQENRELLQEVEIVVPVRPAEGVNCDLATKLSLWFAEGSTWSFLNDHMGGFIELTRGNIAYSHLHRERAKPGRYLLMIDNDMVPPINLPYLLARHNKPVVGAPAIFVHPEYGPTLNITKRCRDGKTRWPHLRRDKIPASGLIEIEHVGSGAIMIRRDVLESFTFDRGDIPFYIDEELRVLGAKSGRLLKGEDLAFCEQVRAKGFGVFADLEALCGHRKTMSLRWDDDHRDASLVAETWEPQNSGPVLSFGDVDGG
jgi:GT2 family glycosyltransferase